MSAPDPSPEVLLFVIDAGGGHRAAARALLAAAEQKGVPWRFHVANLQEVLARFDLLRRATGLSLEEGYNLLLRRRWTAPMVPMLRVLHGLIALRGRALRAGLTAFLASRRPAAVVSVLPNFNGVIRDALHATHPGVPFLVLLTDYADFPPHFWMEPGLDRVIVGSDHAVDQALALGLSRERVSRTSGMVLHPRFYPPGGEAARARVRRELGVGAEDFLLVLLFGGKGSPEMQPLAARLLETGADWHVVAICGDNPRLYASLAPVEAGSRGRLHRLAFTDRVADYMAACDLLVTKPGPGSLAEAFHQGVPVVVTRNLHTIPQERFNTRLVEQRGLGLVVRSWRQIPEAVSALARDRARLAALRANVAALPENRAVWEALAIVAAELGDAGASGAASRQTGHASRVLG